MDIIYLKVDNPSLSHFTKIFILQDSDFKWLFNHNKNRLVGTKKLLNTLDQRQNLAERGFNCTPSNCRAISWHCNIPNFHCVKSSYILLKLGTCLYSTWTQSSEPDITCSARTWSSEPNTACFAWTQNLETKTAPILLQLRSQEL